MPDKTNLITYFHHLNLHKNKIKCQSKVLVSLEDSFLEIWINEKVACLFDEQHDLQNLFSDRNEDGRPDRDKGFFFFHSSRRKVNCDVTNPIIDVTNVTCYITKPIIDVTNVTCYVTKPIINVTNVTYYVTKPIIDVTNVTCYVINQLGVNRTNFKRLKQEIETIFFMRA